jgi:hypothetical protein
LDINKDIDMKQFRVTELQSLARLVDIQRWYNAVHSRGRVCGIYNSPWEAFNKDSHMGSMWSNDHLDQAILDRQDIMYAALHILLSSKGIVKGNCEYFSHLVSQSKGNGYLALYQIVRMVHPVLCQFTPNYSQPSQKKTQSFSEHVSNYDDYFQSESCWGRKYYPYEQVALILSRLHPIWKDAMQQQYKQLVPHGGPHQLIPMECNLEMISVTLSQWCTEERLEHPHPKASYPTPARVFEGVPPIEDFAAVHLDDSPLYHTIGRHDYRHGHCGSHTGTRCLLHRPQSAK